MPEQIKLRNKMMDYLQAQPLSPNKLYVYWHLDNEKTAFICRYFHLDSTALFLTLRLYEPNYTGESGRKLKLIHEVILRPNISSWLFKGLKGDGDYLIELGVMRSENDFFPMLRYKVESLLSSSVAEVQGFIENTHVWSDRVSTYTYYENVEGSD